MHQAPFPGALPAVVLGRGRRVPRLRHQHLRGHDAYRRLHRPDVRQGGREEKTLVTVAPRYPNDEEMKQGIVEPIELNLWYHLAHGHDSVAHDRVSVDGCFNIHRNNFSVS